MLRQQRGFRRARRADTVVAALVGACDGELAVGALLDAVAQLLDRDPDKTRATYLRVVSELVDEGFLVSGPARDVGAREPLPSNNSGSRVALASA